MDRPEAPDKLKHKGIDLDRRNLLTLTGASMATFGMMSILPISFAKAQDMTSGANNFYTSDTVTLQGQSFHSQEPRPECEASSNRRRASDGSGEGAKRKSVCHENG